MQGQFDKNKRRSARLHAKSESASLKTLLEMPLMGLGTFIGMEADQIADPIERNKITTDSIFNALAIGYRHLDLAENYGNLDAVSTALKKACQPKSVGGLGIERKDIWLTMKANAPFSNDHIVSLLKQMGVEYFDLFLIHHSTSSIFDSEKSLLEAWGNLCQIEKSKLNRIGVSNCYEPHLERLLALCEGEHLTKPYANEVELNLNTNNVSLVKYCKQHEIKMIAYSPLGYNMSMSLLENPILNTLATKIKATPAQTALAKLMSNDIAVIPKSSNKAHLVENFQSQDFILPVQQNATLCSLLDANVGEENEAVTETAISSKKHAQSLEWKVETTVLPVKKGNY